MSLTLSKTRIILAGAHMQLQGDRDLSNEVIFSRGQRSPLPNITERNITADCKAGILTQMQGDVLVCLLGF